MAFLVSKDAAQSLFFQALDLSRTYRADRIRIVAMRVHHIDPIRDMRWNRLILRHPRSSVFHSVGWLKALHLTYGYTPVGWTTTSPDRELQNGLIFCQVRSWLTGPRLVSLPFSDHCEPLCDSVEELNSLICRLETDLSEEPWAYLEVRPVSANFRDAKNKSKFSPATKYFLHILSLDPAIDVLFSSFDRDCVQRRIRRAERAGLIEKCGRSESLLKDFYGLFVSTRRRHCLPPMPFIWFQNLVHCMGEAAELRLAYQGDIPVSAIFTLRFKDVVLYKYGCSNAQFKRFGATPWLLWRAIVEAKANGATKFDLGRTEEDNLGLLEFKNHWVPEPEELTYWRFPRISSEPLAKGWKFSLAKRAFSAMPDGLLKITGRLLYRHVG